MQTNSDIDWSRVNLKGSTMSSQDKTDGAGGPIPVRPPVFSPAIDKLIKEIWELGGMRELQSSIDTLKLLPEAEFEARLTEIRDRLKAEQ